MKADASRMTGTQRELLDWIRKYPGATARLLCRLTDLSDYVVRRDLAKLCETGAIRRRGHGGPGARQFAYQTKD